MASSTSFTHGYGLWKLVMNVDTSVKCTVKGNSFVSSRVSTNGPLKEVIDLNAGFTINGIFTEAVSQTDDQAVACLY